MITGIGDGAFLLLPGIIYGCVEFPLALKPGVPDYQGTGIEG